jgi:chemotaxis protein MotB
MDPFSPNFWNEEVRPSNDRGQLAGRYDTTGEFEALDDVAGLDEPTEGSVPGAEGEPGGKGDAEMETASVGDKTAGEYRAVEIEPMSEGEDAMAGEDMAGEEMAGEGEAAEEQAGEDAMELASATDSEATQGEDEEETKLQEAAENIRAQISESMKDAFGEEASLISELSVVVQDEGILISLTDGIDVAMYDVGSAIPSRDLVVAMEKIGGILAEQDGGIRIRGHTDARPFKSKDYDNWRLSAARAQSAYYMLLRGGLDETRVQEISGFADRELLLPDTPLSPKNRRIEVLVEVPGQ